MGGCLSSTDRAEKVCQTKKKKHIHKEVYSFPAVTFIFKKDIIDYMCPFKS